MTRKVLVTGATGVLGGEAARALRARGDHVVALVRTSSRTGTLYRLGCDLVEGDLAEPRSVARAARGCELVVHAATRADVGSAREDYWRVNVVGTENLLRAAREAGVRRVVHVSSASVYGGATGVLTESTTLRETGLPCPDSKVTAERLAFRFAAHESIEVCVVRPAQVYGPGDRSFLPRLAAFLRRRAFVYPIDPETPVNITHVSNAVDLVLKALDSPRAAGEAFNVSDGEPMALRTLVELLCRHLRAPLPLGVPASAGRVLARVLDAFYALARQETPVPTARTTLLTMACGATISIDKAREVLGWSPRVASGEGIARACEALE